MTALLERLLALHGLVVYAIIAALVFAEDALFVGFVVPGETAAVLGGVAASRGHVGVAGMLAVVAVAAIAGDSVGYEVGRWFGPRLLDSRLVRGRRQRLDQARDFLARRGGAAVLLGRLVAFFRAVMPALAGIAGLRYRVFLTYNAIGGILWATGTVMLGYLAGNSYTTVEHLVGRTAAVAAALIVAITLLTWRLRRHRAQQREPAPDTDQAPVP